MTASNTNEAISKHRDIATQKQCRPKGNPSVNITELVKRDFDKRAEMGLYTYGEVLRPFNGRDALVDKLQEDMDSILYFRQLLYELDKIKLAVRQVLLNQDNANVRKLLAEWAGI